MAFGLVIYDLLYFTVAFTLFTGAGTAGVYAARSMAGPMGLLGVPGAILAVLAGALVALLALIGEVGVLTAPLPRLRAGRYPIMKGKVFWTWLLRSLLRRVLFSPGVKTLLFTSNVLRWLALRALGARVAFASNMSSDVDLLDPALLTVGRGAILGARTFISGHYIAGGRLVLGAVEVGPGTLCAASVHIAPGAVIGADVRLLATAVVGADARIGAGALIGPAAKIDNRAIIEPGARVDVAEVVRGERPG